jgi:hypothetical protein
MQWTGTIERPLWAKFAYFGFLCAASGCATAKAQVVKIDAVRKVDLVPYRRFGLVAGTTNKRDVRRTLV